MTGGGGDPGAGDRHSTLAENWRKVLGANQLLNHRTTTILKALRENKRGGRIVNLDAVQMEHLDRCRAERNSLVLPLMNERHESNRFVAFLSRSTSFFLGDLNVCKIDIFLQGRVRGAVTLIGFYTALPNAQRNTSPNSACLLYYIYPFTILHT